MVLESRVARWQQLVGNAVLTVQRLANTLWLHDLGLVDLYKKLPTMLAPQMECLHDSIGTHANQWSRITFCLACQLRLRYIPTVLALKAVVHREAKRRGKGCKGLTTRLEARAAFQQGRGAASTSEQGTPNAAVAQLLDAAAQLVSMGVCSSSTTGMATGPTMTRPVTFQVHGQTADTEHSDDEWQQITEHHQAVCGEMQ